MKLEWYELFSNNYNNITNLYRVWYQILISKNFYFCYCLTLRHTPPKTKSSDTYISIQSDRLRHINRIYLLFIKLILLSTFHVTNTISGDRDTVFVKFIFTEGATVKVKQWSIRKTIYTSKSLCLTRLFQQPLRNTWTSSSFCSPSTPIFQSIIWTIMVWA